MITNTKAAKRDWDVVIVGGGPAGCQAAISAASEGLKTLVVERRKVGGQIGQTPLLENFLGFENGTSGATFATLMQRQAERLGAHFCLDTVVKFARTGEFVEFELKSGDKVKGRNGVIAAGQDWNIICVNGFKDALGKCVFYGPSMGIDVEGQDLIVIGGGNSAGQSIIEYARPARSVHVLLHSGLKTVAYLTDRIKHLPNVKLWEHSNLMSVDCEADPQPEAMIAAKDTGSELVKISFDIMLLCPGCIPNTRWLADSLPLSPDNRILTGAAVGKESPLETAVDGVYAVGDVRNGSIQRVTNAIGDGGAVTSEIWKYRRERNIPVPFAR